MEASDLGAASVPRVELTVSRRILFMSAIVVLHVLCYWVATRVTAARGPGVLLDLQLPPDRWIPHLPATWPLYWIAYPFVVLGAGAALVRLPDAAFRRAVVALAAMTVVGAAIQVLVPAQAPWPAAPAAMQRRFHASALVLPFATFPSMHVAYCSVAAGLLAAVMPGRVVRVGGGLVVALVALSTLTLKEHVLVDLLAGLALALAALAWWRRGLGWR